MRAVTEFAIPSDFIAGPISLQSLALHRRVDPSLQPPTICSRSRRRPVTLLDLRGYQHGVVLYFASCEGVFDHAKLIFLTFRSVLFVRCHIRRISVFGFLVSTPQPFCNNSSVRNEGEAVALADQIVSSITPRCWHIVPLSKQPPQQFGLLKENLSERQRE